MQATATFVALDLKRRRRPRGPRPADAPAHRRRRPAVRGSARAGRSAARARGRARPADRHGRLRDGPAGGGRAGRPGAGLARRGPAVLLDRQAPGSLDGRRPAAPGGGRGSGHGLARGARAAQRCRPVRDRPVGPVRVPPPGEHRAHGHHRPQPVRPGGRHREPEARHRRLRRRCLACSRRLDADLARGRLVGCGAAGRDEPEGLGRGGLPEQGAVDRQAAVRRCTADRRHRVHRTGLRGRRRERVPRDPADRAHAPGPRPGPERSGSCAGRTTTTTASPPTARPTPGSSSSRTRPIRPCSSCRSRSAWRSPTS